MCRECPARWEQKGTAACLQKNWGLAPASNDGSCSGCIAAGALSSMGGWGTGGQKSDMIRGLGGSRKSFILMSTLPMCVPAL